MIEAVFPLICYAWAPADRTDCVCGLVGKIQNVRAPRASNLVLVLRVNLSRTDVFKEEGEGFRGGMAGGKMERGHLL